MSVFQCPEHCSREVLSGKCSSLSLSLLKMRNAYFCCCSLLNESLLFSLLAFTCSDYLTTAIGLLRIVLLLHALFFSFLIITISVTAIGFFKTPFSESHLCFFYENSICVFCHSFSCLLLSVHLGYLFLISVFSKPGCPPAFHCPLQDRYHNVTSLLLKVVCLSPITSNNYLIWPVSLLNG